MKKKFAAVIGAAVLALSGCSLFGPAATSAIRTYNFDEMELIQFEEPDEGQPLAVINTSAGTIKAILYPEYAPNTVDNFINRAKEGFYNGKDIYAVVDEAFFLTGSYNEEGTQGFTNDGNPIANEYSVNLWTFKGALCAYNGKQGYGDSRFFVINDKPLTEDEIAELRGIKNSDGEQIIPDKLIDAFVEKGSVAHFAGYYTVFGQTIEGFEVIDRICTTEVDENTARPVSELIIESIEITEYVSSEEEAIE